MAKLEDRNTSSIFFAIFTALPSTMTDMSMTTGEGSADDIGGRRQHKRILAVKSLPTLNIICASIKHLSMSELSFKSWVAEYSPETPSLMGTSTTRVVMIVVMWLTIENPDTAFDLFDTFIPVYKLGSLVKSIAAADYNGLYMGVP
jgi:hypothetical protein